MESKCAVAIPLCDGAVLSIERRDVIAVVLDRKECLLVDFKGKHVLLRGVWVDQTEFFDPSTLDVSNFFLSLVEELFLSSGVVNLHTAIKGVIEEDDLLTCFIDCDEAVESIIAVGDIGGRLCDEVSIEVVMVGYLSVVAELVESIDSLLLSIQA